MNLGPKMLKGFCRENSGSKSLRDGSEQARALEEVRKKASVLATVLLDSIDFIAKVNALAKKLGPPKEMLPAWDGKLPEGECNLKCGKRAGFLYFDAKNIVYGVSQSKFEFRRLFRCGRCAFEPIPHLSGLGARQSVSDISEHLPTTECGNRGGPYVNDPAHIRR